MSSKIEKSIKVNVPVSVAYNQWTQFEEFPQFMDNVRSVEQKDDTHLHWRAEVGGEEKEWDAEITTQVPDQKIIWESTEGAHNRGIVDFYSIDDNTSEVSLKLEYDTDGLKEKLGDAFGVMSSEVEQDLERFKSFIESRGSETGGWRGGEQREPTGSSPRSSSAGSASEPGSPATGPSSPSGSAGVSPSTVSKSNPTSTPSGVSSTSEPTRGSSGHGPRSNEGPGKPRFSENPTKDPKGPRSQ